MGGLNGEWLSRLRDSPTSRTKWIWTKGALFVFEVIKIRGMGSPRQILTTHAHKGAGEVRIPRWPSFIRKNTGVKLFGQPAPVASIHSIREIKTLIINLHPQLHRCSTANGDGISA